MVVPLIISYGLYRLDMPKEFVITFMMIGLNIAIYWIVITAAIMFDSTVAIAAPSIPP